MKESHLILRFVFTTFLFQTALFSGCDFGEPKTQETMSSAPKSTGDSFYQLEVVENAAMKGQVDRYRFKLLKPVLLKDFLASEIVESILGTGASLKMDLLPHAESAETKDQGINNFGVFGSNR